MDTESLLDDFLALNAPRIDQETFDFLSLPNNLEALLSLVTLSPALLPVLAPSSSADTIQSDASASPLACASLACLTVVENVRQPPQQETQSGPPQEQQKEEIERAARAAALLASNLPHAKLLLATHRTRTASALARALHARSNAQPTLVAQIIGALAQPSHAAALATLAASIDHDILPSLGAPACANPQCPGPPLIYALLAWAVQPHISDALVAAICPTSTAKDRPDPRSDTQPDDYAPLASFLLEANFADTLIDRATNVLPQPTNSNKQIQSQQPSHESSHEPTSVSALSSQTDISAHVAVAISAADLFSRVYSASLRIHDAHTMFLPLAGPSQRLSALVLPTIRMIYSIAVSADPICVPSAQNLPSLAHAANQHMNKSDATALVVSWIHILHAVAVPVPPPVIRPLFPPIPVEPPPPVHPEPRNSVLASFARFLSRQPSNDSAQLDFETMMPIDILTRIFESVSVPISTKIAMIDILHATITYVAPLSSKKRNQMVLSAPPSAIHSRSDTPNMPLNVQEQSVDLASIFLDDPILHPPQSTSSSSILSINSITMMTVDQRSAAMMASVDRTVLAVPWTLLMQLFLYKLKQNSMFHLSVYRLIYHVIHLNHIPSLVTIFGHVSMDTTNVGKNGATHSTNAMGTATKQSDAVTPPASTPSIRFLDKLVHEYMTTRNGNHGYILLMLNLIRLETQRRPNGFLSRLAMSTPSYGEAVAQIVRETREGVRRVGRFNGGRGPSRVRRPDPFMTPVQSQASLDVSLNESMSMTSPGTGMPPLADPEIDGLLGESAMDVDAAAAQTSSQEQLAGSARRPSRISSMDDLQASGTAPWPGVTRDPLHPESDLSASVLSATAVETVSASQTPRPSAAADASDTDTDSDADTVDTELDSDIYEDENPCAAEDVDVDLGSAYAMSMGFFGKRPKTNNVDKNHRRSKTE